MPEPKLGRLIAIHPTSPQFLQRAAIVVVLSFIFFLGSFIFYLIWRSSLYFLLSTSFLIVQLFTIVGWWMQKRNSVSIYENGLQYRKNTILWADIALSHFEQDGGLSLELINKSQIKIPAATDRLHRIAAYIDAKGPQIE